MRVLKLVFIFPEPFYTNSPQDLVNTERLHSKIPGLQTLAKTQTNVCYRSTINLIYKLQIPFISPTLTVTCSPPLFISQFAFLAPQSSPSGTNYSLLHFTSSILNSSSVIPLTLSIRLEHSQISSLHDVTLFNMSPIGSVLKLSQ